MCVIERRTFVYNDGDLVQERTHYCSNAMGDRLCNSVRQYDLRDLPIDADLRSHKRVSHGSSSTAGTTVETASNADSRRSSTSKPRTYLEKGRFVRRYGNSTVNVASNKGGESSKTPRLKNKPAAVIVDQPQPPSAKSPLHKSQASDDFTTDLRSPSLPKRGESSKSTSRESSKDKGKGRVYHGNSSALPGVSEDEMPDSDDDRPIPDDMDPSLKRGLIRERERKAAAKERRHQERQAKENDADEQERLRSQMHEAKVEELRLREELDALREGPSRPSSSSGHQRQTSRTHVVERFTTRTTTPDEGRQARGERHRLSSGDYATTQRRPRPLNLRGGASTAGSGPSTPVRESAVVTDSEDEPVTSRRKDKSKKKPKH